MLAEVQQLRVAEGEAILVVETQTRQIARLLAALRRIENADSHTTLTEVRDWAREALGEQK